MFPDGVSTPSGKMKGSFGKSPGAVNDEIKRERAEATVAAKEREEKEREKVADTNKNGESAENKATPILPETVDSAVYGTLKFEDFKEKYESVFDQVRDKVHLTKGYVEFETELGGQKIALSSLTKGQQRFVNFVARGDASMTKMPSLDEQEEFGRWFLLMAITKAGAKDVRLPKPPRISSSDFEKDKTEDAVKAYLEDKQVESKLTWLDDLANEVYQHLFNIVTDLMTAVFLAVREDVLNP